MNSSQLDLWEREVSRTPWRGQSPRGLTRVACSSIFKAQAAKDALIVSDSLQLEIFPSGEKAPWIYQGAPLLKGGW